MQDFFTPQAARAPRLPARLRINSAFPHRSRHRFVLRYRLIEAGNDVWRKRLVHSLDEAFDLLREQGVVPDDKLEDRTTRGTVVRQRT